jgi:hypothetical protein
MSTRCQVAFCHGTNDHERKDALVYVHSDGYPEGVGKDLLRFFEEVKAVTKDTRFDDPEFLAARFVAWKTLEYAAKGYGYKGDAKSPLNQTGIGVSQRYHYDIQYLYVVQCGSGDPEVFVHKEFKDTNDDRVPIDAQVPLEEALKAKA